MFEQPKVLARVGGKAITSQDVDAAIAAMGQRGQNYQTPKGREIVHQLCAGKDHVQDHGDRR